MDHLDLDEIKRKMLSESKGVKIKDRKWFFRTYPQCFVGEEAVDWLLKNIPSVSSRDHAVAIGNQMLRRKMISHVTGDHDFKDKVLFYKFL